MKNNTENIELEKGKIHIVVEIIEYMANAVVSKTIIKKTTGNVTVSSFDAGEELDEKISPFDTYIQIIDGVADLCSDVNNIEESNRVVQKLMKWTKELNCHIVTVIHSNFGTDKPTGHLGSFLEKKTETQIQLELNTVNKGLVKVSCKRSRNAPFEDFNFKVNNFGLPQVEGAFYDPLKDIF
jgi:hypothetical protein